MKGSNKMNLNEATMMDAVQEYLNKRTAVGYKAPKVTGVKADSSYGSRGFDVTLTSEEAE